MNHSRKKIVFAIFLSIVVFVGGSLSVLAKPPFKATLLGVYAGETSSTYKALKIVPINNMVFGVYSDTPVEVSTNLRLYFGFGVDSVSSFSLSLKKLNSSWPDDASTSLTGSGVNIDLITYNSYGTVTGYTSIKTAVQTNRDTSGENTIYNWTWSNSSALSYSGLMITIPFQSFILSTAPLYFEMLGFSVNGDETQFSAYESGVLSAVQGIEQAINDDSDLPIDTDDIPSAPDTSSINTGTQTATGYINDFFDEFATGGAVGRVLLPISTYLTVADSFNDNSTGHRMITIIFKLGCGLVIVAFIINGIKRRGDFT